MVLSAVTQNFVFCFFGGLVENKNKNKKNKKILPGNAP